MSRRSDNVDKFTSDKMDPWLAGKNSESEEEICQNIANTFEDDFKPTVSDTLPDSEHYLQTLGSIYIDS